MGSVFGKPVKPAVNVYVPTPYDAIQKLHRQVETINLSIKQKTTLAETYQTKSKECASQGKREDAKLHLIKKAMLEKRVTELIKMASNLETQIVALESISMNRDIIRATEISNTAMKSVTVSPDDAANIMENVRETMDAANEVSNVLTEPLGDTVDVSDELDNMMEQPKSDLPLPEPSNVVHLPPATTEIEQELRKLEAAC